MDAKTFIEKHTSSSKNLEVIRESIQKLTRFISPLGKLLEYIHEDVEAMQSELSTWRQAYMKAEVAIKREKEYTISEHTNSGKLFNSIIFIQYLSNVSDKQKNQWNRLSINYLKSKILSKIIRYKSTVQWQIL